MLKAEHLACELARSTASGEISRRGKRKFCNRELTRKLWWQNLDL